MLVSQPLFLGAVRVQCRAMMLDHDLCMARVLRRSVSQFTSRGVAVTFTRLKVEIVVTIVLLER